MHASIFFILIESFEVLYRHEYTFIYMAGIVVLYHFLFSSFEYIVYMFKTGEQKVIQENDSCHLNVVLFDKEKLRFFCFVIEFILLS
jgi:hypothetical protein